MKLLSSTAIETVASNLVHLSQAILVSQAINCTTGQVDNNISFTYHAGHLGTGVPGDHINSGFLKWSAGIDSIKSRPWGGALKSIGGPRKGYDIIAEKYDMS